MRCTNIQVNSGNLPRPARAYLESGRAAYTGAPQPTVAARVLREVLLVVILRVIERRGHEDLGRDGSISSFAQRALVTLQRSCRQLVLRIIEVVDARTVLRPAVVSLSHALGRVVALPEYLEEIVIGEPSGPIHDQNHLVVSGPAGADILVCRVRGLACGVAYRRCVHALRLPELSLGAPEAAQAEHRLFRVARERAFEWCIEDEMTGGDWEHTHFIGRFGRTR
jgi:acetolactate synthase regulatory subunit